LGVVVYSIDQIAELVSMLYFFEPALLKLDGVVNVERGL
jgi:hypothetical protein